MESCRTIEKQTKVIKFKHLSIIHFKNYQNFSNIEEIYGPKSRLTILSNILRIFFMMKRSFMIVRDFYELKIVGDTDPIS